MPRPRSGNVDLSFRLSDAAHDEISRRAEAHGITASLLVERVISSYLDAVLDGERPLHLFGIRDELRVRKYKVAQALIDRMERVNERTRHGPQDICRAAITDFLHVL